MNPQVAYINTLVKAVREDRGLTLQYVELTTHYASSTIHDWEHGRGRVDPDYLARLFQLTGDVRILQFFAPGLLPLNHAQCGCPKCAAAGNGSCGTGQPVPPPLELKRATELALSAVEQFCKYAKFVHLISADGAVTEKDDDSITQLHAHGNNVRDAMAVLDRSIAYLRDQWQRQNGGRR